MRITGGGSVIERGPEEEGLHPASDDEFWQESVVFCWWDRNHGVGGFHRIGHEPNWRDGPIISLWNHVFTPHHIYKDASTLPLRDADKLPNGLGGGDTCRFEYTDHAIWTIDAPDVKAELHAADCHTPVDIFPKNSDLTRDFAPEHMEVAGTVSGCLQIKGRSYDIDGLAFRDHGWGRRVWSALTSHRWVAMSFGHDMMALAQTFHTSGNELMRFGCVIRNNELTLAEDVDVITYMEPDALTHRGGRVRFRLTTGEVLTFDCETLQKGAVSWIHGISCFDSVCKVTCGELEGICAFEATNNPLRGAYRPYLALNGFEKNGLHELR